MAKLLAERGVRELYPPQVDAVKAGALEGRNILLASPTASGKTLVAELCVLKHVLEKGGKALYLTPLRALASEKYEEFKKYSGLVKSDGKRFAAAISTGDYDSSDPWLGRFDVVLTTNEKADSLLRHKSKWLDELTVVVADEVHLITEPRRGPTLEVVLARVKQLNPNAQLIALSATVENAEEVAEWLDAASVTTEWRPVPLKEGVYHQGEVTFKDGSSRLISRETGVPPIDIALESVADGGQALIFTETRKSAVEMSRKAVKALKGVYKTGRLERRVAERILGAREKTRLSAVLAEHVKGGAGFHHAGLSAEHRRLVEDAFRSGVVKILSATPTLAAGVNMPARTVVLSSYERYEPGYGRYPISVLEYKQICGRAGRPMYDRVGEAVLVAKTFDEQEFLMEKYVLSKPEKLWSKLAVETVLRPHVLSTIATGYARSEEGLKRFFSETFFAHQYGGRAIEGKLGHVLRYLFEEGFVDVVGSRVEATRLGRRVSELYIDPESAVVIRSGLGKEPEVVSELSYLHLTAKTPDLAPKLHPRAREKEALKEFVEERRFEFFGEIPDPYVDFYEYEAFLAEVKTAQALLDWVNETPEDEILKKHGAEPGDLARLVELANWLLYAVEQLAPLFGKEKHQPFLRKLRLRVEGGVREELVPLVQLRGVGRVRARALYNSGYRTVEDLRKAPAAALMAVPSIGPETARMVKEQVGGKMSREEWLSLKKEARRVLEQKLISEYREG